MSKGPNFCLASLQTKGRYFFTYCDDIFPREFAIQTYLHETRGAEELCQNCPTQRGIVHVVEHANALDDIEVLAQFCKVQDVSLHELQSRYTEAICLSLGITETRAA